MFPVRTPAILRLLMPRLLWRGHTAERVIHLTFDDGPTPGVTEQVLALLAQYNAKATFFCIGDKVQRHPETLRLVQAAGHTIGNHTHHHLNLWKTPLKTWLEDTATCQAALTEALGHPVKHFRPPYGKIGWRAAASLLPHYRVVMWDVLCGDWDAALSVDVVAGNAIRKGRPGSIIVLHDSEKAADRMLPALPQILAHFAAQGYRFEAL